MEKVASPFRRLAAQIVDAFFISVFYILVLFASLSLFGLTYMDLEGGPRFNRATALVYASLFITHFLYIVLPVRYAGATIGKKLLGMKIVRVDGKPLDIWDVLIRETVGRLVSQFFLIGYIVMIFHPKYQALHDIWADTLVVLEEKPLEVEYAG